MQCPLIHSKTLLDECYEFLTIGLDEWGAASGCWDDCVNAWMLAMMAAADERRYMPKPIEEKPEIKVDPWLMHDIDADLQPKPSLGRVFLEPFKLIDKENRDAPAQSSLTRRHV